jgi:hypothetical protein
MDNYRIPYSRVRGTHRYFEPTRKMKAQGFAAHPLGPEGPEARLEAWRLYEEWQKVRQGLSVAPADSYPFRSVGWAWERYRRTETWASKAPRTREEWDYVWIKWIEPVFGDVAPSSIEIEDIEQLRSIVLDNVSLHAAHRLIKVWRALWRVMAAMRVCACDADPSKAIRNKAPRGRHQIWKEGEVAILAKAAWRRGYEGLAALLCIAWDTQFSPVDCRSLTPAQRVKDARGTFFDTSRAKTARSAIGTLSRRSVRVLDAYLLRLGVEMHDDAPIFRNRSGGPYSKDTLGDDFRALRNAVFPGDTRRLMDIRRSGAVEAVAGAADPAALAAKMGNSIDHSRQLQNTYLPKRAATVRLADEARKRGRTRLRENE